MIGVFLAISAYIYPSLALVLIWASVSLVFIACGYGGVGAKVFGKEDDGKIPIFFKLVLFPYLLFTWAVWNLIRLLSKEDAFNQIDEEITVGRRLLHHEISQKFDHYVDLTAEFDEPNSIGSASTYRCLPILDAGVPYFLELDEMLQRVNKGNVYIHCAQGHGRTGLFAIALLYSRGKIRNIKEGLVFLQESRPAIKLNSLQENFLTKYFKEKGSAL